MYTLNIIFKIFLSFHPYAAPPSVMRPSDTINIRKRYLHPIYLLPNIFVTPRLYWGHGDNNHETWLVHQHQLSFLRLPISSPTPKPLTCLSHHCTSTQVYYTPIRGICGQPTRPRCNHSSQEWGNYPPPLCIFIIRVNRQPRKWLSWRRMKRMDFVPENTFIWTNQMVVVYNGERGGCGYGCVGGG